MGKKKPEIVNVARECDCWLEIGVCFCTDSNRRYTVHETDKIKGRFDNLNQAVEYGRSTFDTFHIYDNKEQKIILKYGTES